MFRTRALTLLLLALTASAFAQDQPPASEEVMPAGEEFVPTEEHETPPEEVPAAPVPEAPAKPFNAVKLRGLNKVTARTSTFDAPLGAVSRFGNVEIIPRKCWQAPPENQPENAAMLQIRELKPGEGPRTIFSGWMFASSPALSALENAVYDITVLSCEVLEGQ